MWNSFTFEEVQPILSLHNLDIACLQYDLWCNVKQEMNDIQNKAMLLYKELRLSNKSNAINHNLILNNHLHKINIEGIKSVNFEEWLQTLNNLSSNAITIAENRKQITHHIMKLYDNIGIYGQIINIDNQPLVSHACHFSNGMKTYDKNKMLLMINSKSNFNKIQSNQWRFKEIDLDFPNPHILGGFTSEETLHAMRHFGFNKNLIMDMSRFAQQPQNKMMDDFIIKSRQLFKMDFPFNIFQNVTIFDSTQYKNSIQCVYEDLSKLKSVNIKEEIENINVTNFRISEFKQWINHLNNFCNQYKSYNIFVTKK